MEIQSLRGQRGKNPKLLENRSKPPFIQYVKAQEQIEKNQQGVVDAIVQILYEVIKQSSLHQSCWSKYLSGFLEVTNEEFV